MKVCWDNLEKLKFTRNGTFRSLDGKRCYVIKSSCATCGKPYFDRIDTNSNYCSHPCSRKGKQLSEHVKLKIAKTLTGRFVGSLNSFFGKKHSENTKIKWLENKRQFGSNNHQWLGGGSVEPYCDIWRDREYKEFIKNRDDNRCLNPDCWKTTEVLTIHHIDYDKKNCHPKNLITLCGSCNSRANKDREWHEAWYSVIITNRYKGEGI